MSSLIQHNDVSGVALWPSSQPSWCVQFLLFSLCQEVNRVGGQTLPKVTLQELLKTCMTEVLAGYEKLSEAKQEKVRKLRSVN